MLAGYTNLIIQVGADFSIDIELEDSNSQPLNLSEYTGYCKIRKSYYSNIDVYSLSVTITTPEEGKVRIHASSLETMNIKPGRYVYDVELVKDDMSVLRILEGIAEVRPSSTLFLGATGATGATGI